MEKKNSSKNGKKTKDMSLIMLIEEYMPERLDTAVNNTLLKVMRYDENKYNQIKQLAKNILYLEPESESLAYRFKLLEPHQQDMQLLRVMYGIIQYYLKEDKDPELMKIPGIRNGDIRSSVSKVQPEIIKDTVQNPEPIKPKYMTTRRTKAIITEEDNPDSEISSPDSLEFKIWGLEFLEKSYQVKIDNEIVVNLNNVLFRLFKYLVTHPNQKCDRQELFEYAWPDEKPLTGIVIVSKYMCHLRDRLRSYADPIKTLGGGYMYQTTHPRKGNKLK